MRALLFAALLLAGTKARASWPDLSSGPLEDDSFLIEEAYNQEAGVVQHISLTQYDRRSEDWVTTFTQEWPVPDERHQLSFTVPYTFGGKAGAPSGVGDVLLNYRYQLLHETPDQPAVAPRLSLILPTGDYRDGLGTGSAGLQANLAASKQLSDQLAVHLNLGGTVIPHALAPNDPPRSETLGTVTGGGSVVWGPVDAVDLMCELLASHEDEIRRGGTGALTRVTLSPGVRIGWNGPGGIQWVGGIGLPIGLTHDADDLGVLLYVSIEHGITAAAHAARWP